MPEFRIGISGWTYAPWRRVFFPEGLAQKHELSYASRKVNSIEINGTFYSLQTKRSFERWYDETPEDFIFSVKAPRFITHIKRLRDVEVPLANFFASGVLRLREKLGPILWQLPPNLPFRPAEVAAFLRMLPRDTDDAARLARHHDHRIQASDTRSGGLRPIRHAMEVRHASFATPEFIELLRRHRVALVVADTAGKWPLLYDVSSDFVYVRLHGDEELYVSGYTPAAIALWARRARAWLAGKNLPRKYLLGPPMREASKGRDVFVYFDNDAKIKAPYDAMSLAKRLKVVANEAGLPAPRPVAQRKAGRIQKKDTIVADR